MRQAALFFPLNPTLNLNPNRFVVIGLIRFEREIDDESRQDVGRALDRMNAVTTNLTISMGVCQGVSFGRLIATAGEGRS